MNSNLATRFKFFVADLCHKMGTFGSKTWNSSAQDLEKQLKSKGINLPFKLYYVYNLPDGTTRLNYMRKLSFLEFCNNFNRIDEYKNIFMDSDKFTPEEKELIVKEITEQNNYDEVLRGDFSDILALNPELQRFKSENKPLKIIDIIAGAVFGFAPDEIDYYCYGRFNQGKDIDSVLAKEEEARQVIANYGFRVGYILAPRTAKKIIAALEKNRQNINVQQGRKL